MKARTKTMTIPSPEVEAKAYLRGLFHRGCVAPAGTRTLAPGVTHVAEIRKGVPRVRRKRFTA